MAIVVPDAGEAWLLETMLRRPIPTPYSLWAGLWKNNVSILKASILADLTPATFAGYAAIELPRTGWAAPQSLGGVAQIFWDAGAIQWIASAGSQLVYGVYVTDPTQSVLLWGETLGTPFTITTTAALPYLPLMRLNSAFQP